MFFKWLTALVPQMWYLTCAGWPKVYTGSESNAQHILTAPVNLLRASKVYESRRSSSHIWQWVHLPDWGKSRPAAQERPGLWKEFWRSCAKPFSGSYKTNCKLQRNTWWWWWAMITSAAFDFWKTQGSNCMETVAHSQCCASLAWGVRQWKQRFMDLIWV